ncbi:MAG: universal stress protein [Desulfobacteraceae bacterium]|nr:universal stress protein [Desulfobacteraceae bacterium]MCF8094280.1 universal stress protein [Desulfobacteraceae bacterium]
MKIMVCYTGSGESREALYTAIQRAKAMNAGIYLVASLEKGTEEEQKTIGQLEQALKAGENKLKKEGIPCETHLLVRGMAPAEDLLSYAAEQEIDEMVIGIRKRSRMGKLIFGSTAQYLILNAPCPVLTVKKSP